MTYTNVHMLLEGDAELRERYAPLVERFEMMQELALILNAKREKRGSIDFDLPEPLIEFDEFGAMTGVKRAERNIAHRIIEEFMLAANEAVAEHLEKTAPAAIYRIHEQPDARRVMEFEEVATHFGYSLGIADAGEEVCVHGAESGWIQAAAGDRHSERAGGDFVAQLSEAGGEDRRASRRSGFSAT